MPDVHLEPESANRRSLVGSLARRVIPEEWQPPRDPGRRLLARLGYYRLRTSMAAHGQAIADAGLYQPLFSPWQGEPRFERLYRSIEQHTLVSRDRCYVLWRTLLQAASLDGDAVECGVFRGGTALLEAQTLAESWDGGRHLHLFDSFEGMPETVEGVDRFAAGDLRTTSAERVRSLLLPYSGVEFHVGYIPDTFAGLELERIAWAHIDVDIYQSVVDSIDFIYPRLLPGGFMIFDDYGFPSCPGARRAVDQAFAGRAEVPLCLPTGQCLVVKIP